MSKVMLTFTEKLDCTFVVSLMKTLCSSAHVITLQDSELSFVHIRSRLIDVVDVKWRKDTLPHDGMYFNIS